MRILFAPYFRKISEIFSEADHRALQGFGEILWNSDAPLSKESLLDYLPKTELFIGTHHDLPREHIDTAPNLSTIIDVAGAFPKTINYAACQERSINIYTCSPCFAPSVGEMALTMILASTRGLLREHVQFVAGQETWQSDNLFDFSVYKQKIGLIGFGATAQSFLSLIAPFNVAIEVFDPLLPPECIRSAGHEVAHSLADVLANNRIVVVFAAPTSENYHLLNKDTLSHLQEYALLVLISRAHLCDFDALSELLYARRIAAAIDVFPSEPFDPQHPIRKAPNVVLSAHRACSIMQARKSIGHAIVTEFSLIMNNKETQLLKKIDYALVERLLVQTPSTNDPHATSQCI